VEPQVTRALQELSTYATPSRQSKATDVFIFLSGIIVTFLIEDSYCNTIPAFECHRANLRVLSVREAAPLESGGAAFPFQASSQS
jgi:hypothetical protein